MTPRVLLAVTLLGACIPALAQEQKPAPECRLKKLAEKQVKLQDHEPNFLGITKDSDDVAFMDFTISLQHPILFSSLGGGCNLLRFMPYFAFTGRFGQYIWDRDSAPVIGKRYNPKLFGRFHLGHRAADDSYIDLEVAHESNGQGVTSESSFQLIAQDVGSTEYAKDYISRSWNYTGITYKRLLYSDKHDNDKDKVTAYLSRKWYCGCWVDGGIEEYFPWEEPRDIESIKQVSGWRFLLSYKSGVKNFWLPNRMALSFDTGARDPLQHNTYRAEIDIAPISTSIDVPFVFWYRNGYLSDIAQYYKRGQSLGVAFVFETL